jgi:hypothetical protein
MNMIRHFVLPLLLAASVCAPAAAQRPDPTATIAAQKEAMSKLAFMDGVWRGKASTVLPNGQQHEIIQTERVGPFLDGSLRLVEGRGYEVDGKVSFNAFAVMSYDVSKKAYSTQNYAMGQSGAFPVTLTPDGFIWEIAAGPAMTIRYTATVKNGTWHEVGDRIMQGKDPVRFFEMTLKRVSDSSWPAGGAISRE